MMINRRNYEQYAIDFLEGKLNSIENSMFINFLENNSDISAEIKQLQTNYPSLTTFKETPDFSFLLKDINTLSIDDSNFDEMCIAFYEGDLSINSKKRLVQFISSDPSKKQKFELFGRLIISPDNFVVFKNKNILKQGKSIYYSNRKTLLIASLAAAASVALFLLFQNPVKNLNLQHIAQTSIIQSNSKTDFRNSKKERALTTQKSRLPVNESSENIKKSRKQAPVLAAIDTNTNDNNDYIRISMIDTPPILQVDKSYEPTILPELNIKTDGSHKPGKIREYKQKGAGLFAKASALTVNKIIESGVKGLNNMAETNLKYIAQTNDKGRITELELSSEYFNISRKIRNN
jgi:hypothetical protein